jgi:protein TonB
VAEAIAPERVMPTAPTNEQATPAAAFEPVRGEPAGTSDEPFPGEVHGTPEASVMEALGDAGIASARAAYLASVRARLESRKHYPYLLRRQGIAGTVLVAFTVGGSGEPSAIRAADGPHHPHLVEAAVRSVKAAAPFAPLPAELAELQIEVPIAFVLENE